MPGFVINGEGVGPNSLAEVRRTHRWLFESTTHLSSDVLLVLKEASRPSVEFEQPEMHHNQERVYFAGKHEWEPISLQWYDVEQDPDVSAAMWDWMEICLSFSGETAMQMRAPNQYKATTSMLQMRNGLGNATETWEIYNGWPQQLNWGELDYAETDLQLIEVEFRFDRAKRVV